MSELDYGDIKEITDVLFEHYYSIGIKDGVEAVGNLIDDYLNGYLDDNLIEWGVVNKDGKVDHLEFRGIIFWSFVSELFDEEKLFSPANWFKSSKTRTTD